MSSFLPPLQVIALRETYNFRLLVYNICGSQLQPTRHDAFHQKSLDWAGIPAAQFSSQRIELGVDPFTKCELIARKFADEFGFGQPREITLKNFYGLRRKFFQKLFDLQKGCFIALISSENRVG